MMLPSDYSSNTERIVRGTMSEIQMYGLYAVTDFPIQDDQAFLPWFQPIDPSGALQQVKEVRNALDGSRGGFGGYTFSWVFGQLTPYMVTYLRDYIFNGPNYFDADVTVVTFDRSYGWRTINCKALWNDPGKDAEPKGLQGYQNLKIDFIKGEDASYGRSYSRAYSVSYG